MNDSSTCHTFNNIIHNSYLCKLQNVEICMIMYYHEHHDDYKFIVMWFIDIADEVHDLTCAQNDGDEKGISSVCDDSGKLFLMLKNYQNWMTYEVNCSIYWQNFVYTTHNM